MPRLRDHDFRLSAIRSVEIHWADDYPRPTQYLVPESDMTAFIAATIALHGEAGGNPHNGATTRRAVEIQVVRFTVTGPYWWTTPGLGLKPHEVGARTIEAVLDRTIAWQCPRFAAEQAAQDDSEAA